ncbi:MAG: hypothetical protein ABL953_07345 [Ilumatobacteraceae bacterium]
MKSAVRTWASVVMTSATVAVGLVAARAVNDNDDSGSAKVDDSTAAIVVDADSVIETGVDSTGTPDGGGGSGGGAAVGDAATGAGLMFIDDPIEGPSLLPQSVFDGCAGSSAGAAPGAGCPVGYAGVLGGEIPPAPFVWGTPGRYLTAPRAPFPEACPASTPAGEDHNAITVFSRTPLESLTVRWRPYGATSDPWVPLVTSATPVAERSAWMTRFETEDYSREAFGYLTLCGIHIDRDPNVPYEVVLDAVDTFGRPVSSRPFVMHDGTPSGRPPTQAYVLGDWVYIDAWAPATGYATFATRTITDPEDRACPVASEGVVTPRTVRDDQVFVSPIGVYDPSFNRKISTWVPLPPGTQMLVCTSVYTGTTQTPLATDIHLIQATGVVEFVVYPAVVLLDRGIGNIPAGTVSVTFGSGAEGCGETILNPELSAELDPNYYRWPRPEERLRCSIPLSSFHPRPTEDPRVKHSAYELSVSVSSRQSDGEWVTRTGYITLVVVQRVSDNFVSFEGALRQEPGDDRPVVAGGSEFRPLVPLAVPPIEGVTGVFLPHLLGGNQYTYLSATGTATLVASSDR